MRLVALLVDRNSYDWSLKGLRRPFWRRPSLTPTPTAGIQQPCVTRFHSVRVAFASPSWTQKQKLKTIRGLRRQIPQRARVAEREKRFSVASIGVAGAVTALMTCDLIDDSGPYTTVTEHGSDRPLACRC